MPCGSMGAVEAPLLLIAHGTRDPAGGQEMAALTALCRQRLGVAVGHAWIEDFARPSAVEAALPLVEGGVDALVALPFLNFAAYHAKTDVPAEVAAIRAALPDVTVHVGGVLGVHEALLTLACERVDAVSERSSRDSEVLVVAASGSSDPLSNAEVARAARLLAERTGHRWVEPCFAAATWPRSSEVLRRAAAAGAPRAVVFSWSLLAGLLEARVRSEAQAAAAETGLTVAFAGRFGPDALVAEAVADRYAEALRAV